MSGVVAAFERQFEVKDTPDLRRVLGLKRRPSDRLSEAEVRGLSEYLRLPGSTATLRPAQALSLVEASEQGGLVGALRVGGGKTLLAYLLLSVLKAKRPLLLLPHALLAATSRAFALLAEDWQRPPDATQIMSYERLSSRTGLQDLRSLAPDLVVADECHSIANPRSARTRRLGYYLEQSGAAFCGLSGTILNRPLAHLALVCGWALGEGSPLPLERDVVDAWGAAVDHRPVGMRAQPGRLADFLSPTDGATPADLRRALGRWVRDTPGVVSTSSADGCDATIVGSIWCPQLPREVEGALARLEATGLLPNGDVCMTPADTWRHARELCLGFHYHWETRPPPGWLEARYRWGSLVRRVLEQEQQGLDSEGDVARAVEGGAIPGQPVLERWRAARGQFQPKTVPAWLTGEVLRQVRDHLRGRPPTLVWVAHRAVGVELAKVLGVPYFGMEGRCGDLELEDFEGTCVASISSNGTGRNLQKWSRNLVLSPPSGVRPWEQLIGRTHRSLQAADEVFVEVLAAHTSVRQTLRRVAAEAAASQQFEGEPSKFLLSGLAGALTHTPTKGTRT